jgi:phosphatidylserine/phosphatidylglycerophosphate/cardiolipin synthase-like enzyme
LISSINWNDISVRNNREVGIIIHNESVAKYYESIFFYDWNLEEPSKERFPLVFILIFMKEHIGEIMIAVAIGSAVTLVIMNRRRK